MPNNYLITGYWGEPHVTAENDRGINAAIFGTGKFVLDVGKKFRAEYIGNNTVRMYDGKLMDNGSAAGIPTGEYVDLLIYNAGQNMNRNDIIAFQYHQDTSTMVERGEFVVIQGEEVSGTARDPELTHGDLLDDKTTFEQMPLWRIQVSGAAISAPVQVFEVVSPSAAHSAKTDNPHNVTAAQVGADPKGSANTALTNAKAYTDEKAATLQGNINKKAPMVKWGSAEVTDGEASSYPEGTFYAVI